MQISLGATYVNKVQASTSNYHYSCSGDVYVNTFVWVDLEKVVCIWTTTTDEAAFCEIGHSWPEGKAFCAWKSPFVPYATKDLGPVTPGTYVSYKVYYDGSAGLHRFYKGSTLVNSIKLPEMTSCWPVTNAERWWDDSYCDNLACFKNLKYKSSSTGSTWYNWPSARTWYDNDPLFNNSFVSSNHVDVVRDAP